MKSVVKWFDDKKGYGFIENGNKEDIYVHYTSLIKKGYRTLIKGERVKFDLIKTNDGYKAKNVISY